MPVIRAFFTTLTPWSNMQSQNSALHHSLAICGLFAERCRDESPYLNFKHFQRQIGKHRAEHLFSNKMQPPVHGEPPVVPKLETRFPEHVETVDEIVSRKQR